MIKRSQHFGLALEAQHATGVFSEPFRQYLQRHVALQLGVTCTADLFHAARADGREDLVVSETSPRG